MKCGGNAGDAGTDNHGVCPSAHGSAGEVSPDPGCHSLRSESEVVGQIAGRSRRTEVIDPDAESIRSHD